ncbi:focadhesin-like [Haliotis cracherodii]|uniref:focadhesin-like n=1 Tax=Haliotis cracherodii TaxID=6455 RepID=UPI0039E90D26
MEDIKRRLEVKHPAIQIQAVWRLYSDVVKKSGKATIDASTPEILELKALWDSCSSPDRIVSEASAQALVKLVVLKEAEFTYVINSLLNIVPSARSLQGVVPAISQLLTLQAEAVVEAGHSYECPYSIRYCWTDNMCPYSIRYFWTDNMCPYSISCHVVYCSVAMIKALPTHFNPTQTASVILIWDSPPPYITSLWGAAYRCLYPSSMSADIGPLTIGVQPLGIGIVQG